MIFPNMNNYLLYIIEILVLFKVHILSRFFEQLDYTFGMKEKWENIVDFVKMILFVLMAGHFMAILYHGVAYVDIYFNK